MMKSRAAGQKKEAGCRSRETKSGAHDRMDKEELLPSRCESHAAVARCDLAHFWRGAAPGRRSATMLIGRRQDEIHPGDGTDEQSRYANPRYRTRRPVR